MPEVPTPAVNGQLVGSPALQASTSISSFDPAATTEGSCASIATAGSFCLFWAKGLGGLPTETSVSVAAPAGPGSPVNAAARTMASRNANRRIRTPFEPVGEGPGPKHPTHVEARKTRGSGDSSMDLLSRPARG